ncbi:MAG: hydantoinase/oxoprolinase family protein [Nitrososphaerales archaeon]
MVTTIDIDVGGTFTEAVVDRNGAIQWGKVQTTPHDLSVGVVRAIFEVSKELGIPTEELLRDTAITRYSTTFALNSLIQRKGVKLGLITTSGQEDMMFIGRSRQWGDGLPRHLQRKTGSAQNPEPLVSRDMVVGVKERTDSLGNIIFNLDRNEVVRAVRKLLAAGARSIIVLFLFSFLNPKNELLVREVVEQEVPEVYLGSVPVFLSCEVQPKWLEYPRLMTAVLNAYLHREMSEQLNNLANEIRKVGYSKPLMLVHNSGGMAKLARSKVTDTYNAGPVAGMVGSLNLAGLYGIRNILTAEMGGTTFNIGIISEADLGSYETDPIIDRWAVNLTVIENRSIGAGGGSIAWFNKALGNRLEVGPKSAGSNPGPVCYDLGGREPTVTDADLVLGYLNESFFLGGKIKLNKQKAIRIIKEKVAEPLGIAVEDSAWAIKNVVDEHMSSQIFTDVVLKGCDPREFTMFTFGGAGPTHAVGINSQLGTGTIMGFPFGAVFDAIGASFLDIRHIYEKTVGITVSQTGQIEEDFTPEWASLFNSVIEEMKEKAVRDVKSEGLSEKMLYLLELDMRYETQLMVTKVLSPVWKIDDSAAVKKIVESFRREFLRLSGIEFPSAAIRLENLRILAQSPSLLKPTLPRHELGPEDSSTALKSSRKVFWKKIGYVDTKIYDLKRLKPGNTVYGPVVVEAPDTTFVVPEEMKLVIDGYGNVLIKKTGDASS